jgi:hemoglobin
VSDVAVEASHETEADRRTPYQLIGGKPGVRALVDRFYDIMDTAPYAKPIRAMHGPDLGPMRERLFMFLSGWLGGPPLYFEQRPGVCIRSAHAPFAIGAAERDAWLRCMFTAMEETGVGPQTRRLIEGPLFKVADLFTSR